jgi:hypothetical protein
MAIAPGSARIAAYFGATNQTTTAETSDSQTREKNMPKRVISFAPMVSVVFLAAAITISACGPALSGEECIENPGQSIKGRWWYRFEGQKCWHFLDSSRNVQDAATPHVQANAVSSPTLSARPATRGLTGSMATARLQNNSMREPRAFRGKDTNAPKTKDAVRVPDIAAQPKRDALFDEFLRWREGQQTVSRDSPLTPLP